VDKFINKHMKPLYTVYLLMNTVTQKKYVGITRTSLNRRWTSHKSSAKNTKHNHKLPNAIRKYGVDVWNMIPLEEGLTLHQATEREKVLISEMDTYKSGYNSSIGGESYGYTKKVKWSEERRLSMSQIHKGKSYHPGKSGRDNQRFGKPGTMTGRKHSTDTKNKMSTAHTRKQPVIVDGKKYESKAEACRELNLTYDTLRTVLKRQQQASD